MVIYNVLNALLYCARRMHDRFGLGRGFLRIASRPDAADRPLVVVVTIEQPVVVLLAILGFKRSPSSLALLPGCPDVRRRGDGHHQAAWFRQSEVVLGFRRTGDRTGTRPTRPKIGFWHIASFAWDLQPGDARRAVGHGPVPLRQTLMVRRLFLVWRCSATMAWTASIMGRAAPGARQAADDPRLGRVAFTTLGISGALAVVIAGWTTPTPLSTERIGPQAVTPAGRMAVTPLPAPVTTVVACFPFVS